MCTPSKSLPQPLPTGRLAGGLIGLLVGDALGVPYEFHSAADIPLLSKIEFDPPGGFRRTHYGTPPGTWSDDGAQALALLASLLDCGKLDLDDFAGRLLAWADRGAYAVDDRVFDIGGQTSRAFGRLRRGVPSMESGPSGEWENGNGSLMRALPLALWHTGSDAELAEDAQRQSLPTHMGTRAHWSAVRYTVSGRAGFSRASRTRGARLLRPYGTSTTPPPASVPSWRNTSGQTTPRPAKAAATWSTA